MTRLLPLIFLLSACTTHEVKQVKIPIPVPCIDPSMVPPSVPDPSSYLKKTDPAGVKIKALLIEREALRQADSLFRILVKPCLEHGNKPQP